MSAVSLTGTPLPRATVQPAAAAPAGRAAALGSDAAPRSAGLALTGTTLAGVGAAIDGQSLVVPEEFLRRLEAVMTEGTRDADAFAAEHTPSERWMVPDWALLKMAFAPKSDTEELAYLHQVVATRTDAGVQRAQYWAKHGLTDEWVAMLDDYAAKVGPGRARAARKLLHDALMMVNSVTQTGKSANLRKRPFTVDPTLKLAVDKPGNSPSYPSGHTSAAVAAGLVLSHLMPDRRAEFMGMAREAAWARVYAGVHFPTDVLAGAKLATTIASHLVHTSLATPVTGTGAPVNPGVAGSRAALPGAVQLAGEPIAAGVAR